MLQKSMFSKIKGKKHLKIKTLILKWNQIYQALQKDAEKFETNQSFYILGKFSGYIQLHSFYRRYQGSKWILGETGIFKGILS